MGCKASYNRCIRKVSKKKGKESAKGICGWSVYGRKKKKKGK